jgi:hypothetical protein
MPIFLQGKVPCVEQMQFKGLEITLIGIGSFWAEKRIIFAPDNERRGLIPAKVGMSFRIAPQVGRIVVIFG